MSVDARRVIYEGNENRNRRIEEYRRVAWECGKEEGRREACAEWEGALGTYPAGDKPPDVVTLISMTREVVKQARREERERLKELIRYQRAHAGGHVFAATLNGKQEMDTYVQACDDILAALEEPEL